MSGKKVLTSEMTDKLAEVLKEMEDIEFEPGQEINIPNEIDLGEGFDPGAWYIAYKT
jgi:hypothetical protein